MTTSHKKRPHTTVGDGQYFLVVGVSCYEDAYKSRRCARIAVIEARNECSRLDDEAAVILYDIILMGSVNYV